MVGVKYVFGTALLVLFTASCVRSTCVFESEFGFTLNCAFKKSGLFRVRNLGGIKAHLGLGFSVGDDLGFDQSLLNTDTSRRRSVSVKDGAPSAIGILSPPLPTNVKTNKMARVNPNRINVVQQSSTPRQTLGSSMMVMDPSRMPNMQYAAVRQMAMSRSSTPLTLPPFKPLPSSPTLARPINTPTKKTFFPYAIPNHSVVTVTPQNYGNLTPQQIAQMVSQMTADQINRNQFAQSVNIRNSTNSLFVESEAMDNRKQFEVPAFQSMPDSVSRISQSTNSPNGLIVVPSPAYKNSLQLIMPNYNQKGSIYGFDSPISIKKAEPASHMPTVAEFVESEVQGHVSPDHIIVPSPKPFLPTPAHSLDEMVSYNTIPSASSNDYVSQGELMQKIAAISRATNISMEAIQTAILMRQQQMANQVATPPPTTTTKRPTQLPVHHQKRTPVHGASKVMNAPREYYPIGYDKNFDDNFESKVDLPDTTFHCGDQKHFPGLYGDEDLGCMVFHVCALTEEGLIMKSFLCPESTLFDQTILKCNWWFYVDCKSSRKTYDSNIPVSKSYQLMKALTFFSSYKKDQPAGQTISDSSQQGADSENLDGIKEALNILQTQNAVESKKVEIVEKPVRPIYSPVTPVVTAAPPVTTPATTAANIVRTTPKPQRRNKGLETVSAKQVSFLLASVEENNHNIAAQKDQLQSASKSSESIESVERASSEQSNHIRKRRISSRFSNTTSNNKLIHRDIKKDEKRFISTTPLPIETSTKFTISMTHEEDNTIIRGGRISRSSKEDINGETPLDLTNVKVKDEKNKDQENSLKINSLLGENSEKKSLTSTSKGEIRIALEEEAKKNGQDVFIVLPENQN